MPRWLAKVNKRVFNPFELRRGNYPVLTHVGRASGTTYRTPLEVHPIDGGFIFVLMYGSGSDWVQNVLAAGSASLFIKGEDVAVNGPRVVDKAEATATVSADVKLPPDFLRVGEFLRMDRGDEPLEEAQ